LRSADCKLPDDGLVKPKHVGAFIVYFNVNINILKQIVCALVELIKDWITSECTVQLWGGEWCTVLGRN